MAELSPAKKSKPSDKKILVVDDDDSILLVIKTALEIEGFQVRTGRDGRNMLQRAVEFQPDLIVTDLMMPGGGGYELLRALQSDPTTQKVPVIVITGSHLDKSTQSMMQLESNLVGYLEKPFRPETLAQKVHKILNTMTRQESQKTQEQELPSKFIDGF